MSSRKFSALKADLYRRSPASRGRVDEKVAQLTEELRLAELRSRTERTQAELAELIGTSQSGVSRLERQRDILVSTLREYVEATGGRLRLIAEYPDHTYEISLPALGRGPAPSPHTRAFHVVWQDIRTRQFVNVGQLQFTGDRFVFSYTPDAELHPGFEPFPDFPDLRRTYESDELFPFFAQRIASSARPSYQRHLDALGLTRQGATPVELLARSWGQSPHDTIQVVPEPQQLEDGTETLPFLVSGVRHAHELDEDDEPDQVSDRVVSMEVGQQLGWRDQPENRFNDRAITLGINGKSVGWIPDYLLDYVHKKRGEGYGMRITVLQANGPDEPWHLRLLCRLEMRMH